MILQLIQLFQWIEKIIKSLFLHSMIQYLIIQYLIIQNQIN